MATVSDTKDFELQGSSITFNIGKSNYKRCHHHNYLEIFMMLGGEVAHYHKDKKYILGKNAIAVIRPGEEHFFRKHKSAHLRFNISVTLDELKKITDALYPEFYSFLTSEGEPFFFLRGRRDGKRYILHRAQAYQYAKQPQYALF